MFVHLQKTVQLVDNSAQIKLTASCTHYLTNRNKVIEPTEIQNQTRSRSGASYYSDTYHDNLAERNYDYDYSTEVQMVVKLATNHIVLFKTCTFAKTCRAAELKFQKTTY